MASIFNFLFGSMTHLWFWLALIFTFLEIETFNLVSLWFVIGAIFALMTSLLTDSLFIQLAVFGGVSAALIVWVRGYAVKRFKNASGRKDNLTELLELPCVIVQEIDDFGFGELKLQGKIWRFRSHSNQTYEIGDQPVMLRVEGNTIIVK